MGKDDGRYLVSLRATVNDIAGQWEVFALSGVIPFCIPSLPSHVEASKYGVYFMNRGLLSCMAVLPMLVSFPSSIRDMFLSGRVDISLAQSDLLTPRSLVVPRRGPVRLRRIIPLVLGIFPSVAICVLPTL